jgi:hydroxymethylglutaryl-CoA synthase
MGMNDAIVGVGVHTPRFRLSRDEISQAWGSSAAKGVKKKAVPAADEDAITMAVSAARDAINNSPYSRSAIEAFSIGTTTPPMAEEDIAARASEILGLNRTIETTAFTQSTRAGTRAIIAGKRVDSGPTLVVASDCPIGEPDDAQGQASGAGAVALVLASDGVTVISETASFSMEFAGTRFRNRGSETIDAYDATAYERDAFRSVIAGAVSDLDESAPALAPTATDGGLPYRSARGLDFDAEVYETASSLGDVGAASPLFGLLDAWNDGHSEVIVVGYGDGASADAIRISGAINLDWERDSTQDISYSEYLRKRGHIISDDGGEK